MSAMRHPVVLVRAAMPRMFRRSASEPIPRQEGAARTASVRLRLGAAVAAGALLASAIGAGLPVSVAAAAGDFTVAPTALDFGSVALGETASLPVLITNVSSVSQTPNFAGGAPFDSTNFGGSQNCAGKTFAPGDSCTFTYQFQPTTVGPHSTSTTIGIDAENYGITMSGTGIEPTADLAASIAASPNPVKSRAKLTYTITILNAGPSDALHVLLNDFLSSQSTFLSVTPSQGSCVTPVVGSSGTVSCSLGTISSGATSPIKIKVTVIAKKTTITNTVTVSSTTSDPNLANNTASITTRVK
jgi:uncharacterized repeat protein (TIGR01451 family)